MAVNSNILVKGTVNGNILAKGTVGGAVSQAKSVIVKELTFNNRFEFPSIGKKDMLYIATDENKLYFFNEDSLTYYCIGSDYNEIEAIQGIL